MALLIHGAHETRREAKGPLIRALEAPAMLWLGAISYSLYLVHAPVLASLHVATRHFEWTSLPTFAVLIALGVPLAVLAAFGFHLGCERPFLSQRPARATAPAPALS
jgi:peptidoglycan/LPS O-acetylase OafA/YrhL